MRLAGWRADSDCLSLTDLTEFLGSVSGNGGRLVYLSLRCVEYRDLSQRRLCNGNSQWREMIVQLSVVSDYKEN